jgi:protease-4
MTAGLVDQLGNLQDAVDVAGELAGIVEKPRLVYPPKEKAPFFEYFVEETISRVRQGLHEQAGGGLKFLWSGV